MAPGSQSSAGSGAEPIPPPLVTRAYGPDPAQVYDVRLPDARRPAITVVLVHGGFWRERHDRSNIAAMAYALADDGFAVAVLEYRRVGMPGGGWPGTCDDVADGLAAVATDLSLPHPLVAVGHSAGGHLVSWLASRPHAADTLKGVVSLAGCVDLTLSADRRLGDGAVQDFLGGGPQEVPERYQQADPALLVPPEVPVHLVHGTADDIVPEEISRSYQAAVRDAGAAAGLVSLTPISGADHFAVIEPGGEAFSVVLDAIRSMASRVRATAGAEAPESAP